MKNNFMKNYEGKNFFFILALNVCLLTACSLKTSKKAQKPVTEETLPSHITETYQKYAAKDYKGSIEESSAVIKFNPTSAEAYYNRAMAKKEVHDKKSCLNDLKQAKTLYQQQNNNIGEVMVQQTLDSMSEVSK